LLARDDAGGNWLAVLPRCFGGIAAIGADGRARRIDAEQAAGLGDTFFIPYPRWPSGAATVRQWLALARSGRGTVGDALMTVAAALPPVIPAIGALLLGLGPSAWPNTRPSTWHISLAILACLTVAGALGCWAAALGRVQRGRDAGRHLHGLLWDRLLYSMQTALRRVPPTTLAVRLRDALSAAQHEAETPEKLREAGVALVVAVAVLAVASPVLAVICCGELLAGFAVLHCLWRKVGAGALAAGEQTPALEQSITDISNLMPALQPLQAAGYLLDRTKAAVLSALASGARVHRAVIAARCGGRLLFAMQPLTIGIAAAAGIGAASMSNLAAALLAAGPAAAAVFRIGAVACTRNARLARMEKAMPALAAESNPAESNPGQTAPAAARIGRFAALHLEAVRFAYDSAPPLLQEVDLRIERGEMVAVTGRSGSGKTTLLRIMLGQLKPNAGQVRVNGVGLTA
jgi:ABC-type multidrug transport system fused ATPase/permease subunit